jgi:predicted AAA+ superfamily ATPase
VLDFKGETKPMVALRDRIVELRRVRAGDLKINPKNWRVHPEGQRSAVTQMLEDVGFVGALVARQKGKSLELLDGHLRADIADDSKVPVVVVDLTDDEADKILATYDPLAGLALTDTGKLDDLLKGITFEENAELRRMLTDLMVKLEKEETESGEDEREVVGMALQPHEHYDFLVVLCTTAQEWNVLCDKLKLKPQARRGRMGTARAIRASALLKLLGDK